VRRLAITLLAAGLLLLLAVAPVSAGPDPAETDLIVFVPGYVPIDGSLDLLVFTGTPEAYVEVDAQDFCDYSDIEYGVYEARKMVIQDFSNNQHGAIVDVIVSEPLKAGTKIDSMLYLDHCTIDGNIYKTYQDTI
jgi:hypothetical protein